MIKKIIFALFAILLLLIAFIMTTNIGLRSSLMLANWFIAGTIKTENLQGTLITTVHFDELTYEDGEIAYIINYGEFKIKSADLLKLQFNLTSFHNSELVLMSDSERLLTIDNIDIELIAGINTINAEIVMAKIDINNSLILTNNTITINGRYNDYIINGYGDHNEDGWQLNAQGSLDNIVIENFQLNSEQGNLSANGQIYWGNQLNWQIEIRADQLATHLVSTELTGTISFEINSQGTFADNIIGHVEISNIAGNINEKKLSGYLALSSNAFEYVIDTGIRYADADITIKGNISDQWQLNWDINTSDLSIFSPLIQGSIVSRGNVSGDKLQPIIKTGININNLAWNDISIKSLSGDFDMDLTENGTLDAKIIAQQINYQLMGIDEIDLTASGTPQQHSINFFAKQQNNQWRTSIDGSITNNTTWTAALTEFSLQSPELGEWQLVQTANIVVSEAEIKFDRFEWRNQQQYIKSNLDWTINNDVINGNFSANLTELGLIDNFSPWTEQLQGHMVADITLTGSSTKPNICGSLSITKLRVNIPELGLAINDTTLTAIIENSKLSLETELQTQAGHLNIDATIDITQFMPSLSANIKGNNFQVINSPVLMAKVSPDLKITIKNNHIKIIGDLHINEANIEPLDLSNVKSPSEDIVYVHQPDTEDKVWTTELNIDLSLSENIHLRTFGFNGDITGKLNIATNNDQLIIASGELKTLKGEYNLLGRLLNIKEGKLIYTNTVISNPGLYIVAEASGFFTSQTTSGSSNLSTNAPTTTTSQTANTAIIIRATIQGSANNPEIILSSEPAMSQADIISYLVLGRPSNSLNSADAQLILTLANALGSGDRNVVGDVRDSLGLDELTLGTGTHRGDNDEQVQTTSLIVGKYISPKIYIGSRIGLTDPNSTFIMRYFLSRRWMLQSETDNNQSGIDLFYSIDRG